MRSAWGLVAAIACAAVTARADDAKAPWVERIAHAARAASRCAGDRAGRAIGEPVARGDLIRRDATVVREIARVLRRANAIAALDLAGLHARRECADRDRSSHLIP